MKSKLIALILLGLIFPFTAACEPPEGPPEPPQEDSPESPPDNPPEQENGS